MSWSALLAALLLAVCMALPASGQQPEPIWPLDVTLTAKRVGDTAAGTVTIINPTKEPVEVGKVMFDFDFYDESGKERVDIKQVLVVQQCGTTKLPVTLAQGQDLECPFTSNDNTYHGVIRMTAGAVRTTDDAITSNALGADYADKIMPAGSTDATGNSNSANAAINRPTAPGSTAMAEANIPGHDIACDQTDWQGKPAAFCQICNGFDNVLNACSNHKDCIAFDMDWGSNCGYLKASKGPLKYPAPGFTSYILGNTNSGNAASSSETVSGFTSMAEANIQGYDIACGQKHWEGKPAAFCKVCGGIGAVVNACNGQKECIAFDMEGSDCGYLKASKGPFTHPAPGFTSYIRASS